VIDYPMAIRPPNIANNMTIAGLLKFVEKPGKRSIIKHPAATKVRDRKAEVLYEIGEQQAQTKLTRVRVERYVLYEVEPTPIDVAAQFGEIVKGLKGGELASESLAELSGMAGFLIVDGLRGGHEVAARAWIVEILRSERAHKDHVEAVADALVNHLVPLWDEVREALKGRLGSPDKYTFMSALMPLLFDASSLDEGLEALRTQIPEERVALAQRLVKKIKQAGAPR
jgi:hypothetical protein